MYENFLNLLKENNIEFKKSFALKQISSFKIGGNADVVIFLKNSDEIYKAYKLANENNIHFQILGNASNSLISDSGINGIVFIIRTENFSAKICDRNEYVDLYVDSSCILKDLIEFSVNNSLTGLEKLIGIPATLGGAVFMNAGAFESEISDFIKDIEVIDLKDGNKKIIEKKDAGFSYRYSNFQSGDFIILKVHFELKKGNKEELLNTMNKIYKRRKDKQPLEYPSCGSVFKRPIGYYAGTLIENAGLKGYKIKGAEISKKHSGFIINTENANAKDVLDLIIYVKYIVLKKYGVLLKRELRIIGEIDNVIKTFYEKEKKLEIIANNDEELKRFMKDENLQIKFYEMLMNDY